MAVRMHPALRLRGAVAEGDCLNSAGDEGKQCWGKRASWIDYFGPVDGEVCGIAIFDHPANHAHPTWWHARDYGLVAANPWGVGPFERKKKTDGQRVKKGGSVTLKYRFYFHAGDTAQAKVAQQWAAFAQPEKSAGKDKERGAQ